MLNRTIKIKYRLGSTVMLLIGVILSTWLIVHTSGGVTSLILSAAYWVIAPYLILGILVVLAKSRFAEKLTFITTSIVVSVSLVAYFESAIFDSDAQSPLTFVFLPIVQMIIAVALGLIIVCNRILGKKGR